MSSRGCELTCETGSPKPPCVFVSKRQRLGYRDSGEPWACWRCEPAPRWGDGLEQRTAWEAGSSLFLLCPLPQSGGRARQPVSQHGLSTLSPPGPGHQAGPASGHPHLTGAFNCALCSTSQAFRVRGCSPYFWGTHHDWGRAGEEAQEAAKGAGEAASSQAFLVSCLLT